MKRQDNGQPRAKWAINGVTNLIDGTTIGKFTYTLSREDGNLRAGANIFEIIDDDVIYKESDDSYYNNYLQIDYYMMKVLNRTLGTAIILR